MNNRLDYYTANYKEILDYAVRVSRNKEIAEDIVQDLGLYFFRKPKNDIDYWKNHINRAVKLSYYAYFNKHIKRWDQSLDSVGGEFDGDFSVMQYLDSGQDLYKNLEKKMILEKMLDEYENICHTKQREALEFTLEYGHYEHPINNHRTVKSNRKHAITKLRTFAETGKY